MGFTERIHTNVVIVGAFARYILYSRRMKGAQQKQWESSVCSCHLVLGRVCVSVCVCFSTSLPFTFCQPLDVLPPTQHTHTRVMEFRLSRAVADASVWNIFAFCGSSWQLLRPGGNVTRGFECGGGGGIMTVKIYRALWGQNSLYSRVDCVATTGATRYIYMMRVYMRFLRV